MKRYQRGQESQAIKPFLTPVKVGDNWIFKQLGQVEQQIVQDEVNDELFLVPETDEDEPLHLGQPTNTGAIIDDHELLDPLLQQGWQISTWSNNQRHAKVHGTLFHPDVVLEDYINWDNLNPASLGQINAGLSIRVIHKRSTRYVVTAGLFRQVCSNGLISRMMDIRTVSFSNRSVSQIEDITKYLTVFAPKELGALYNSKPWLSKETYTPEAITWTKNHITRSLNPQETYRPPTHIREITSRLVENFTKDELVVLDSQLTLLGSSSLPFISIVDILNILTNVSKKMRVAMKFESIVEQFTTLVSTGQWLHESNK